MPTYAYEALNASGKPQEGTVEAVSSEEAVQRIKSEGFFPTSVREQKIKGSSGAKGGDKVKKKRKAGTITINIGRVKSKYLCLFTRQLSTLQDAGLPLLRSIQILEAQQKPGQLKNILSHDGLEDHLRELIVSKISTNAIRAEARKQGMRTLRETGLMAIYESQTTIDEVIRETIMDE